MSVGQTDEISRELERHIRTVPDFPTPGVSFKDITPLIEDGEALHAAVDALADATDGLAYRARKGLILARKPNKLPRETISATYELEYGTDSLEAHADAIPEGTRVLVADDLLATGGTARAMCQLVENAGGTVAGVAFLIELSYLNGRDLLAPYDVVSLITYDDPDE